jgi:hypothetical protein
MSVVSRPVTRSLASIGVGLLLLAGACPQIASLRYAGGEYDLRCRRVSEDMLGGTIDIATNLDFVPSASRIDGIEPTRAFAARLLHGCGSNEPSWVLALAASLSPREERSLEARVSE